LTADLSSTDRKNKNKKEVENEIRN
jgi:hypothetical protein